ncbi:MAG TPA: GapR family DNA-binding domain-containing protein [Stellaceae bacterium]|nr:GapR family DNA-binding domain-containing protein [Stellaceae bacterium]
MSAGHLKSFIERIERLEEEKKALAEDIKDVYSEAKGVGFDVKIIRKIISIRKRDQQEIEEEETILELYLRALGMLPNVDSE